MTGGVMLALGSPAVRVELWDGRSAWVPERPPEGTIRFADRPSLWRFFADPEHGLADGYVDGDVALEGDLVGMITEAFAAGRRARWRSLVWRPKLRRETNGLLRARENASFHYDLDQEFFSLWLDPALVYTCAYFASPGMTLARAQQAKLDHVCRKLDLKPGERLVDLGSGWGALAIHAAQHYGVSVRAYNISRRQTEYARERARALGVDQRVEFILEDYRNVSGDYDALASVGMLEHVGLDDYPSLRRVIERCLVADGRGLLHFIGRTRPMAMNRWIAREVFPGAYFPSLTQMLQVLEPADMTVYDVENLRPHYAKTVERWLESFAAAAEKVADMFDERFVRRWELYLAASAAAFRAGTCQLFQVAFARSSSTPIPWSRAPLYVEELERAANVAAAS